MSEQCALWPTIHWLPEGRWGSNFAVGRLRTSKRAVMVIFCKAAALTFKLAAAYDVPLENLVNHLEKQPCECDTLRYSGTIKALVDLVIYSDS